MSVQPQRPRIIALDDNNDILELVMMALEDKYEVATLNDPVDLYEVLDLFEPDLLVLDVMMPLINGFQLLEMLRKNPGTKDLPIIVLSAKTSAGEMKHGYRLGATLYLTKPFQPERLQKNVETQFQVHPPSGKKTVSGSELARQIELTSAFRKGHLETSTGLNHKEQLLNVRKRIEDRIKAHQAAKRKLV